MSRLPIIQPKEFTPAQQRIFDSITGGKRSAVSSTGSPLTAEGGLRGPFNALLYSPVIGDAVQRVGEAVRFEGTLPPQLRELAILTMAAEWQANFEWWAHERIARDVGVEEAVIDGVKVGALPDTADAQQRMIYNFARDVIEHHQVSDERYTAAVAMLGEAAIVELVLLLGYYSLIAMTLNVFAVAVPEGEPTPWPLR
ncbi:MAG: carboxymuconolactone decarboxylase family protein [Caldilineaceae bacterium]